MDNQNNKNNKNNKQGISFILLVTVITSILVVALFQFQGSLQGYRHIISQYPLCP